MTTQSVNPPAARRGVKIRKDGVEVPRGARWWRELSWRYLVGIIAAVFAVFPVLYVLSASLNPIGTLQSTSLIPTVFSLENYSGLLRGAKGPFIQWFWNSMIVCTVVAAIQILISSAAAYAFSRMRFKGRRGGLLFLLLIQMFPQFVAAVALFNLVASFGKVIPGVGLDTLPGYILVMLGGSLGQVWLIKGFFDALPREIDEAAILDGASHWQIFSAILLPLVRPVLAVTALLSFVGVIGDFMLASLFLKNADVQTLAVGLFGIINGDRSNNLGIFAAGAMLISIPILALFLWLQRYIVGGLSAGSVK